MGLAAPAGRGRPGRQRLHAGCATSSRPVGWGVRGHVAQWRPQTRGLLGCGGIELRPFPTHTCFRRPARRGACRPSRAAAATLAQSPAGSSPGAASPLPRSPARSCTPSRSGAPDPAAPPAFPCRFGRGAPASRAGVEHGRRALRHDVLRAPDRRGRVHGQHLVDDEPVAERPDRREVLLDGRHRPRVRPDVGGVRPDVGRHVQRRDRPQASGRPSDAHHARNCPAARP